jgi:hypothetical protein
MVDVDDGASTPSVSRLTSNLTRIGLRARVIRMVEGARVNGH